MIENNMNYEKIDKYWLECGQRKRFSEQLELKVSYFYNNESEWKNKFPLNLVRGSQMVIYSIFAILCEYIEKRQKRRYLGKLLKLQKDEIAIDINDLLKNKENTRCYGDNFTYNVVTTKCYLKNIEIIFGDAHLEALDDIAYFCNLKKVTGTIYYQGREFESLSEISV